MGKTGKKSWNKLDVEDVKEGIASNLKKAAVLDSKDELFTVDTKGTSTAELVRRVRLEAKNKKGCDKLSFNHRQSLKRVMINLKNNGPPSAKQTPHHNEDQDVWSCAPPMMISGDQLERNIRKRSKIGIQSTFDKEKNKCPSVKLPLPGQSYHPTADAYQDTKLRAIAEELSKLDNEQTATTQINPIRTALKLFLSDKEIRSLNEAQKIKKYQEYSRQGFIRPGVKEDDPESEEEEGEKKEETPVEKEDLQTPIEIKEIELPDIEIINTDMRATFLKAEPLEGEEETAEAKALRLYTARVLSRDKQPRAPTKGKKTIAERNKERRHKKYQRMLLEKKQLAATYRALDNAKGIARQFNLAAQQHVQRSIQRKARRVAKKVQEVKGNIVGRVRCGKHDFRETPIEVALDDQKTSSLRKISLAGSALEDRIQSVFRRRLCEADFEWNEENTHKQRQILHEEWYLKKRRLPEKFVETPVSMLLD
eukprot:Platyproteum_vivax@DN5036_c0_g1_i1.p1